MARVSNLGDFGVETNPIASHPFWHVTVTLPDIWRPFLDFSKADKARKPMRDAVLAWLRRWFNVSEDEVFAVLDVFHPAGKKLDIWHPHYNFFIPCIAFNPQAWKSTSTGAISGHRPLPSRIPPEEFGAAVTDLANRARVVFADALRVDVKLIPVLAPNIQSHEPDPRKSPAEHWRDALIHELRGFPLWKFPKGISLGRLIPSGAWASSTWGRVKAALSVAKPPESDRPVKIPFTMYDLDHRQGLLDTWDEVAARSNEDAEDWRVTPNERTWHQHGGARVASLTGRSYILIGGVDDILGPSSSLPIEPVCTRGKEGKPCPACEEVTNALRLHRERAGRVRFALDDAVRQLERGRAEPIREYLRQQVKNRTPMSAGALSFILREYVAPFIPKLAKDKEPGKPKVRPPSSVPVAA